MFVYDKLDLSVAVTALKIKYNVSVSVKVKKEKNLVHMGHLSLQTVFLFYSVLLASFTHHMVEKTVPLYFLLSSNFRVGQNT